MSESKFSSIFNGGPLPEPRSVCLDGLVEELWTTYVDEVGPLLSRLEAVALELETNGNHEEHLAEIRRLLHSLKGDSGSVGLSDAHELYHEAESALDELYRKGDLTDALLRIKDWTEDLNQYVSSIDIEEAKSTQHADTNSKPKMKALIIDDDPVCRGRLEILLQDFFECTFASDGKEGLVVYEKSLEDGVGFKLITLDINMPGLNGHETLKAIRRIEQQFTIQGLDGVKVIMATSESKSSQVFSAFKEGCEAYVVKKDLGEKLLDEVAKLGLLKVVKVQKNYAID